MVVSSVLSLAILLDLRAISKCMLVSGHFRKLPSGILARRVPDECNFKFKKPSQVIFIQDYILSIL